MLRSIQSNASPKKPAKLFSLGLFHYVVIGVKRCASGQKGPEQEHVFSQRTQTYQVAFSFEQFLYYDPSKKTDS